MFKCGLVNVILFGVDYLSAECKDQCGLLHCVWLQCGYLQAMLVLTTMLTSISDDLPKTAGVKYIGRVQKKGHHL